MFGLYTVLDFVIYFWIKMNTQTIIYYFAFILILNYYKNIRLIHAIYSLFIYENLETLNFLTFYLLLFKFIMLKHFFLSPLPLPSFYLFHFFIIFFYLMYSFFFISILNSYTLSHACIFFWLYYHSMFF